MEICAIEMLTSIMQGTAWDGSDLSSDASEIVKILDVAILALLRFTNLNIYL